MKWFETIVLLCFSANVFPQSWLRIADFPSSKRDDGVAVVVGSTAYFGSGLQEGWTAAPDFKALDLNNNSWSAIPDMPPGSERQYACAFPGSGCFFVFGGDGFGALNNLWKYTVSTSTWTQMSPKPGVGLIGATVFVFGDKIIVATGKTNPNGPMSNEVWEYTISTDTWQQKNNFPFEGRWRASSTVRHNTGYLLFGIDSAKVFRKELISYNSQTDNWTKVSDFPGKGRAYAAMHETNNRLLVFGGYDSSNTYYNNIWFYHLAGGQWAGDIALPAHERKGGMSVMSGGRFYYSCGITKTDQRLNESWILDVPLAIDAETNVANALSIFPQPASEFIEIRLSGNFTVNNMTAEVFDFTGKICLRQVLNGSVLAIESLNPGIYLLRLSDNGNILFSGKVIKQ